MTTPRVTLIPEGDNKFVAEYVWSTYRFLLDDGTTVDVRAINDNSDVRGAVLKALKAHSIVGSAQLAEPKPEPEPVKKRTTKRPA